MRNLLVFGSRTLALLLSILLLALPLAVSAEENAETGITLTPRPEIVTEKTLFLSVVHNTALFTSDTDSPTFWEQPELKPGAVFPEGTLTLLNNSVYEAHITLDGVHLPYGEEQQLRYLNALHLTVRDAATDEILYDGSYVHAADADGGLQLGTVTLAAGEQRSFKIGLRCALDYGEEIGAYIDWKFTAKLTVNDTKKVTADVEPMYYLWIGVGVLLAAVIVFVAIKVVRDRRRRKEMDSL